MNTQQQFERGFAALEAILIVILICIIGFTGWYVWHSQKTANKTLNSAVKTSQSASQATPLSPHAKAALVYQGHGETLYSISGLAQTNDQKAIGSLITKACQPEGGTKNDIVAVTGAQDLFTNGGKVTYSDGTVGYNYTKSGNLVQVNAGCYDETVGGQQGGGADYYLYHNAQGWHYLDASQEGLDCSLADGKGVVTQIKCHTDSSLDNLRLPKP